MPDTREADRHATLAALVDFAYRSLSELKAPIDDPRSEAVVLLYYTMLDLCNAIHLCAVHKRSIAVPTLARQVLDAYVDFTNAIGEEGIRYVRRMELADDQNWLEALTEASSGKNAYYKSFTEAPQLVEWRKLHKDATKEAARQGLSRADAEERFREAELLPEYRSVWKILSASMHNNTSTLRSRHYERTGDSFEIVCSDGRAPYEISCLLHCTELLLNASEVLHEKWGAGRKHFAAQRDRHDELARREAEDDSSKS